jgi:drug/metabolite transporter (DMT)-like permease
VATTLALIAACCWGLQGLLLKYSISKVNTLAAMYASYVVGGILLFPLIIPKLDHLRMLSLEFYLWLAFAVSTNVAAKFMYYHALKIGKVVIVVPIVAAYSVVTLLVSLLSGEYLNPLQLSVLMIIIFGMALASVKPNRNDASQSGAWWAVASATGYGLALWISGHHLRAYIDGDLLSWLFFILQGLCLAAVHYVQRLPLKLTHLNLLFLTGLSGALGSILLTIALGQNKNGMVAVLSSLNGVISVVLAYLFLKERLLIFQWVGVWLALIGVILISLLS